jgi:nickel/cobalt exporter
MALFLLLGFAFLFGVFHTLMPGHQKAIIGAYFLSENARYGQGFLAGLLFAVFHGVMTVTLLLIFWGIFGLAAGQSVNHASILMQTVSAWGLLALAVWLVIWRIKDLGKLRRLGALDRMRAKLGFDLHDRIETAYEPLPLKKFLSFLFLAALFPCQPSFYVVLFSIRLGALNLGLLSVAVISIGMAAALTGIAIAVIASKKTLRRRAPWYWVFSAELAGLVFMVALAFFLIPLGGTNPV